MLPRTRTLALFALGAPALAIAAVKLRPSRARIQPPRPAVVMVDPQARTAPLAPAPRAPQTLPQPILPPSSAPGEDAADPAREDDEPATVTGTVVDVSGRAVPWARITLRDLEGVPVGAGKADQEGHFAVRSSSDSLVMLLAQADDRRALAGPLDLEAGPSLRVVVAPPGRLRGVVVDAHGVPVENAEVVAEPTRLEERRIPATRALTHVRARTDADGRFDLEIATPDAWTVTASRDGYLEASQVAVQVLGAPREIVLTMDPAAPNPRPVGTETPSERDGDYMPALWLRDTDQGLVVLQAPPDSTLLPGDVLVAVDGVSARSGNLWERLSGPRGSTADLEIDRPATRQRFRVQIVRAEPTEQEGC